MIPSQNPNLVDLDQLENLPHELANQQQEVLIQMEINGKSWPGYFSIMLVFLRHAILLTHMPIRTVTNAPKLNQVTSFELDRLHKIFLSFQCYVINPVCERLKRKRDGLLHA